MTFCDQIQLMDTFLVQFVQSHNALRHSLGGKEQRHLDEAKDEVQAASDLLIEANDVDEGARNEVRPMQKLSPLIQA